MAYLSDHVIQSSWNAYAKFNFLYNTGFILRKS